MVETGIPWTPPMLWVPLLLQAGDPRSREAGFRAHWCLFPSESLGDWQLQILQHPHQQTLRLTPQSLLTARKHPEAKSQHRLRRHRVHHAAGSPAAWKRQKFGERVHEGGPSCRPPGLEVSGRSPACAPYIPKELKLILARKSRVLAHIIGGPVTLASGTAGPRRSQLPW